MSNPVVTFEFMYETGYINAEGAAKLHTMVAYVRQAIIEANKGTSTLVDPRLVSFGMAYIQHIDAYVRQDEPGISESMLKVWQQAYDWNAIYGDCREPSLWQPEPTGPVVPFLDVAGGYDRSRTLKALQVIQIFNHLRMRARDTLYGRDQHILGFRDVPGSSDKERVTRIPPKWEEELENALRRYDTAFRDRPLSRELPPQPQARRKS